MRVGRERMIRRELRVEWWSHSHGLLIVFPLLMRNVLFCTYKSWEIVISFSSLVFGCCVQVCADLMYVAVWFQMVSAWQVCPSPAHCGRSWSPALKINRSVLTAARTNTTMLRWVFCSLASHPLHYTHLWGSLSSKLNFLSRDNCV